MITLQQRMRWRILGQAGLALGLLLFISAFVSIQTQNRISKFLDLDEAGKLSRDDRTPYQEHPFWVLVTFISVTPNFILTPLFIHGVLDTFAGEKRSFSAKTLERFTNALLAMGLMVYVWRFILLTRPDEYTYLLTYRIEIYTMFWFNLTISLVGLGLAIFIQRQKVIARWVTSWCGLAFSLAFILQCLPLSNSVGIYTFIGVALLLWSVPVILGAYLWIASLSPS